MHERVNQFLYLKHYYELWDTKLNWQRTSSYISCWQLFWSMWKVFVRWCKSGMLHYVNVYDTFYWATYSVMHYDHPLHLPYKQRKKLLWRTPKKMGMLYIDPNLPSRPNPGKNKHNCHDSVGDNGRVYW